MNTLKYLDMYPTRRTKTLSWLRPPLTIALFTKSTTRHWTIHRNGRWLGGHIAIKYIKRARIMLTFKAQKG